MSQLKKAVKFDQEKPRWDLIPYDSMEEITKVLTFGANKYSDRNWELGMEWGRLIRATIGHVTLWAMGKNKDSETGLSHLAHAGCCILFLIAYEKREIGVDNRSKIKGNKK